jgi:hypothetical protein
MIINTLVINIAGLGSEYPVRAQFNNEIIIKALKTKNKLLKI